jgi:hypothetical protein
MSPLTALPGHFPNLWEAISKMAKDLCEVNLQEVKERQVKKRDWEILALEGPHL